MFNCSGKHNAFYGKKHSKKTREMMSKHHKDFSGNNNPFFGKKHTKKSISKMIRKHKINWSKYTIKKRNKILKNWIVAGRKTKETKIEKIVSRFLSLIGIVHKKHIQLGLYNVDIVINNKYIIECFGDYWHFNPKFYSLNTKTKRKRKKDKIKKEVLVKKGYKYLILWEHDIKNNLDRTQERIRRFLNEKSNI